MENYSIATLLLAGLLAGAVNFFINDVGLVFNKPAALSDESNWKDNDWIKLLGYDIVSIAGAFLTPLVNALTGNNLKGLDCFAKANMKCELNDYLVLFGYGLVFGYSASRLLLNLFDILMKKVNSFEARLTAMHAEKEAEFNKKQIKTMETQKITFITTFLAGAGTIVYSSVDGLSDDVTQTCDPASAKSPQTFDADQSPGPQSVLISATPPEGGSIQVDVKNGGKLLTTATYDILVLAKSLTYNV